MDNAVYGRTTENYARLLSNEKDYLKWTSKPRYISQKMFDNNLVPIFKNKVTLTLRKPAYVRMCIFDLSKVLMFHHDSIMIKLKINMVTTQDYYSLTLIV